ncbi:(2Fe-2S)-binding protein [Xylanimonas allomyrinae]|uniref:(2Fe-2S)-binding protein n=1 Tax=Xylanimonas allomyrinae TaxID=2509459 RepID=A0A4V0YDW6_9MICO|nr:(2Fe-2S)-binding protein [Xylanimonas allomyrinae]
MTCGAILGYAEPTARITIDGRERQVARGITVAAALLCDLDGEFRRAASGGAPRSVFCGMGSCYNCAVWIDGRRTIRACLTPVADGMVVETRREVAS